MLQGSVTALLAIVGRAHFSPSSLGILLPTMQLSAQTHYQAELDAGRFGIQQCTACNQHVFTPRELCPHCGALPLKWVRPAGTGAVYSYTTIGRKPEAGGDYNVALIDLDEGVRMMSRVDGIAPERVQIGMRVKAQVIQHNGKGLVVFQPDQNAQGDAA